MKRILTCLGVGLGAGFLLIGGAPNSWAAGDTIYLVQTTDDNPGGHAEFFSNGEGFEVVDMQADGLRAVGYLEANGTTYRLDDDNGASTPSSAGGVFEDFSFAEGTPIQLRVCLRDGIDGVNQYCSAWKSGTA